MSLLSSTASLRSSLTRQCDENGRKYHGFKAGKYLLPTDDVCLSKYPMLVSEADVPYRRK